MGGELWNSIILINLNHYGILESLYYYIYQASFLPINYIPNNMRLLILLSALLLVNGCSEMADIQLQEISTVSGENSSLPSLYTDNTGIVFMSWVEERGNIAELHFATFKNNTWSEPSVISADSTWFLNWADYPSIIGHNGQPMAAHWLNKKPGGTYAYDVNISAYTHQWSERIIPHQDKTPTEHGFVSMLPLPIPPS